MCWRNYSQTLLQKVKIEHISGKIIQSFIQCVFIVCQGGLSNCRPLAFTSYKAFLRNKKRSGTTFPASFSRWFIKENIFLYFISWRNLISPSHTWLIILIRFITLKNNWMNPCVKTEEKFNESINNEFKIMRKTINYIK